MIRALRWLSLAFALAFGSAAAAPPLPVLLLAQQATPAQLFAAGEQGAWYDPSDLSTMYQDSAGTTPVTAPGQPVGKILDKSGRGNHATQATGASRPTLQRDSAGLYYLACDGSVSSMATAAINFTATDKVTVWVGVTKLSDAAGGMVLELSPSTVSSDGSFYVAAPSSAGATYTAASRGTTTAALVQGTFTAPTTNVLSAAYDIAAAAISLRVNGAVSGSSSASQGTGTYGNYQLYLFRRAASSLPFNGRFYGAIIRGASSSPGQLRGIERWLNTKTGAY